MIVPKSAVCRMLSAVPSRLLGCRGSVAVLAAIAMTGVIGFVALAVDYGSVYARRASLQKVADSAAMAGGLSWLKTNSAAAVTATISSVVAANGYSKGVIQASGTGYMSSSPKNAGSPAVQVTLLASTTTPLASVAGASASTNVSAHSAVEINTNTTTTTTSSGIACVLSLSTLSVNGSLSAPGCTVVANSTNAQALTINSGASLSSVGVQTPGGITVNGKLTATTIVTGSGVTSNGGIVTGTTSTGGTAVADPFGSAAIHNAAASGFTNCQSYGGQTTLTAGCWSNVNVNGGTNLALNPGTYFFTGLNINSGAAMTGTGVTIVTQSNFSPNGNIALTAPSTGTFAGIAMYLTVGMNVNSGVTYNVSGAIYSPTSAFNSNNGTWNQNACTYLVAQSITSNSGSTFTLPQTNCSSYGYPTANIGMSTTTTTLALAQ